MMPGGGDDVAVADAGVGTRKTHKAGDGSKKCVVCRCLSL